MRKKIALITSIALSIMSLSINDFGKNDEAVYADNELVVMAAEDESNEVYNGFIDDYNEFYEDGYSVAVPSVYDNATNTDAKATDTDAVTYPVFDSVQEAGEYFRQAMVDRVEDTIVFAVDKDESISEKDLYYKIKDVVFEETDNPKEGDYLYWNQRRISGTYSQNKSPVKYSLKVEYLSNADQEKEIDQCVSKLLNTEFAGWKNKSDFDNVKNVYDWVTYNYEYTYKAGNEYHSTYSGLINHETVCQGYATSIYRLLREMNISTRVIANSAHGWNIVKLGDVYYNLDATWEDTDPETYDENTWELFLLGETNFTGHARNEKYATTQFYAKYPMSQSDYVWKRNSVPFDVVYSEHVQTYGWLSEVTNGAIGGTTGQAKRLEAVTINLVPKSRADVNIEYMGHVQRSGWDTAWKKQGTICGTTGEARRLEAIKIRLTGKDAEHYDVYYCAHSQTYGWLGWAKNGEPAGTQGMAKRMEAIKVLILPKGKKPQGMIGYSFISDGKYSSETNNKVGLVNYKTHVQTYGWQNYVSDGSYSGTSGESKRLEGIYINLGNTGVDGGIRYKSHIQTYGWEKDWKMDGMLSGTTGQAKRLEGIKIELYGKMAEKYDVYYRTHIQTYGWLGWAKNGEASGSEGLSKRLESIQIVILPKGSNPPDNSTAPVFVK